MGIPDNYSLWEAYDREQARQLDNLPKCKCCDEPIQTEKAVCVDGDYYCEDAECEKKAWERIRKEYLENVVA